MGAVIISKRRPIAVSADDISDDIKRADGHGPSAGDEAKLDEAVQETAEDEGVPVDAIREEKSSTLAK